MLSPDAVPLWCEGERPPVSDPYRQIFDAAGIGIGRVAPDGRVLEANQRFGEIVGRRPDTLVGLHFLELTHPDDVALSVAEMEATLQGLRDRYTIEKRYLRPDGSVAWVMVCCVLVRDAHSQPVQFVATIEDITARRQLHDTMAAAQASERASQAKTEFLSRMSHELRTPLNAMLGFAQLLRIDTRHPLHEVQLRSVQHIERAGAHLLAMLTDVLDLSRIEAGSMPLHPTAVSVQQVQEEALALVSNQVTAGVQLQGLPPGPPLHVQADHVRLRQILVNLLSNAIKYNRPGGRVQIEALPVGSEVVIAVTDTGRGLSETQIAHLFEPFNRLGAERSGVEGTGIGLVIVRRLLELMHGRITVGSVPGECSVFRVWLPVAAPAVEAPPTRRSGFGALDDAACAPAGTQTCTVLYAEDNLVNVELVRQVMRMRPQWHLEIAYSGQEAIAAARAAPPDLLLLDMHLGDLTGLDVADALATDPATACVPRVALSADAMPDMVAEARRRGFVDYLTKPLDVGRLLRLLDQLAAGR